MAEAPGWAILKMGVGVESTPRRVESVKQTLERELKLDVEPGFRLPSAPRPAVSPLRTFISRYYDTPDHRLARHGVTLRCRIEGAGPSGRSSCRGSAARLEVEVAGLAVASA